MRPDAHTLVAAYAADALEHDERADVEEHLARCEVCREDLDGFREALASLAAATAEAPPARMREAVLARARQTPQLPPLTGPSDDAAAARGTAEVPAPGAPGAPGVPGAPGAGAGRPGSAEGPGEAPVARRPRSGGVSRTLFALAATTLTVLALGAGVWGLAASDRLAEVQARQAAVEQVLAADDLVTASARPQLADGVQGDEVVVLSSASVDAAVLLPAGLPEAPEGSTWQAWTVTGDQAVSAGVFDVAAAGSISLSGVSGVDAVAVSLEPEGGSSAPTTDPVLVVPLA